MSALVSRSCNRKGSLPSSWPVYIRNSAQTPYPLSEKTTRRPAWRHVSLSTAILPVLHHVLYYPPSRTDRDPVTRLSIY